MWLAEQHFNTFSQPLNCPGQTLTNLSLCGVVLSSQIAPGFLSGPTWGWLSILSLDWSVGSLLTHRHHALRHITYIQYYTHHAHTCRDAHVPLSCIDAGRQCCVFCFFFFGCFISRALSLQCPHFPADCQILPWHQKARFSSSWTGLTTAWPLEHTFGMFLIPTSVFPLPPPFGICLS